MASPQVTHREDANPQPHSAGGARLEAVNGPAGTLPTWTTFRHKIEVFPGAGQPPAGVTPGSYDDRPQYIYNPNLESNLPDFPGVGGNGQVPMCPDGDPQGLGSTTAPATASLRPSCGATTSS